MGVFQWLRNDWFLFYGFLYGGEKGGYWEWGTRGSGGQLTSVIVYLGWRSWGCWEQGQWAQGWGGRGGWRGRGWGNLWARRYYYLLALKFMRLLWEAPNLWGSDVAVSGKGAISGEWGGLDFLLTPLSGMGWVLQEGYSLPNSIWNPQVGGFPGGNFLCGSAALDQVASFSSLLDIWDRESVEFQSLRVGIALGYYGGWYLAGILGVIYCIYLFCKVLLNLTGWSGIWATRWGYFVDVYLYSWLLMGEDKTESSEEVTCLLILWPWCVLIIFSHLFSSGSMIHVFGFAEWGVPVVYGFILLVEHVWELGVYTCVYLTGVRGRKSLVVNVMEDLISTLIMFARIGLQAVRGVIVGIFHFICREALLTLSRWWVMDTWFAGTCSMSGGGTGTGYDFVLLWADFWIAAGSLVVITAIMFLQLTLLIVSVWLFCKCWYISCMPITSPIRVKGVFGGSVRLRRQEWGMDRDV